MTTPADLVRQDTPDDGESARRAAVQHFLGTGEYDPKFPAWSGNIIERETKATADMLQALVAEVKKLSGKIHTPSFPADLVAFTRKKVEPMVRGLFRRDEQGAHQFALGRPSSAGVIERSSPPNPGASVSGYLQ